MTQRRTFLLVMNLFNQTEKIYLSSSIVQWTIDPFIFGVMLSTVQGAELGHEWLALYEGVRFMVDNGAFTNKYKFREWIHKLKKLRRYSGQCLGVVVPDKPFDWPQTLLMFRELSNQVSSLGLPVALAIQNGVRLEEVRTLDFDTIFVGGDDNFKRRDCWPVVDWALSTGRWIHVGRVNGERNLVKFYGYANSWDGTTFSYHPTQQLKSIRRAVLAARMGFNKPLLSTQLETGVSES